MKLSTYDFTTPSGDVIPMSYVSPIDLMTVLLQKRLDILVGGLESEQQISEHLVSFWKAFRLSHSDHVAFEEHINNFEHLIPLCWHGDEGRGKRRGNTVCVSVESPIGLETVLQQRKRKQPGDDVCKCKCDPPDFFKQKYNQVNKQLTQKELSLLGNQWTNMKCHSFLQHWALFIIPSWVHHEYPQVLIDLLEVIAKDFRRLFFEGVTVRNKNWCFAIVAAKGDLKWYCKIALERSFQNQGRVRDLACCHECQAGEPNLTWEDMSEQPVWAPSRYTQRPWSQNPPMSWVPFCRAAPEKQYKRDPFHLTKVGIFRDMVGSGICWLCAKGYYGEQGGFSEKLAACHSVFKLYCLTTGQTAALRSFTRALFMFPRFSAYPWANTKGSDTMILMRFISVQCTGFLNTPLDQGHVEILQLMQKTCQAGTMFFSKLNGHGLWMSRCCGMDAHLHLTRFIAGYATLAGRVLNDQISAWGMKPKLHLLKHAQLEFHEWLLAGLEILPNYNIHNCEQNEDFIGRVCRLSRRLDSRRIGERVLHSCLVKSYLLYKKFAKVHKLKNLDGSH